MHTELGRIATLSQRVTSEASPLENQVRKVAWLIALIAVGGAIAFIPMATLVAGLSISDPSSSPSGSWWAWCRRGCSR